MNSSRDRHSFSEPEKVRVTHCSLHLETSFEERKLAGTALLHLARPDPAASLILDMRDLDIHDIRADGGQVSFEIGDADPILGAPLTIHLPPVVNSVLIRYSTRPHATGLQWLTPEQTAGKKHPFLFSQNQSIHARSWIPLQDSPGVRITYDAQIKAPAGLKVLMSAAQAGETGDTYAFRMEHPIPSYLIALAIGDLAFAEIGSRTGVYAEPPVLASARQEFADMERMVEAVEPLYGPYRWGRYDLLILPPSFPFGGMENPMLTFATPAILAGDKSLVSLVSHELAHSWSGNLVTNATWRDFWLNEGFTTYIENRIQELVYGEEQAVMEQVIDRRELQKELNELPAGDQILHIDLNGRDPDEGTTRVPYIKGALLLRQMERVFGRREFDIFLKSYFSRYAFQSITTTEALDYLQRELFDRYPEGAKQIPIHEWVYEPGLPSCAPEAASERLEKVADVARRWSDGRIAPEAIPAQNWISQEWLEFLQVASHPFDAARMAELDRVFHLTQTGNYEILDEWLLRAVEANYRPAFARLETFLVQMGRMRYTKPLYAELMKTADGQQIARAIYAKARAGYHPIAQTAIDKIVKL